MEDNLVTIAIHTFEKAQILKMVLESEGIETYIHNVNLIQPMVSAGVRVRIKEVDLTKALEIIERMEAHEKQQNPDFLCSPDSKEVKVLVPVDFSDYSIKACEMAFDFAGPVNAEVLILHTYFGPQNGSVPLFDAMPYANAKDEESISRVISKVNADIENLENLIKRKISKGELPNVPFSIHIREGVPEDEILKFEKEQCPSIIFMGTRGKNRKELDLIGSVTAEVIERSKCPVFAIPEEVVFQDFSSMKNIAYATNFDPKDLIAFEKMMSLFGNFDFTLYFIHISQDENAWNEVKLAGIKEYFKKHYPELTTEYLVVKGKDTLACLDEFISNNKIDIVAINTHKRTLLSKIFNPSFARKMIFHAKTPMLIYHV